MHAAPITAAAIPAGPGADANASGATDLFAGLMAGLFNPAQATPPTAAAIGMQAEAGDGGLVDCPGVAFPDPVQPGAGKPDVTAHLSRERLVAGGFDGRIAKDPEVLPVPGADGGDTLPAEQPLVLPTHPGKPDVTAHLTRERLVAGGFDGRIAKDPQVLPVPSADGGDTLPAEEPLVLPTHPGKPETPVQPAALQSATTALPAKPASTPADAQAAQALQLAARPEVLAVKAQAVEAPALPSPAMLQAVQMQGQGLQPAKPAAVAAADTAALRPPAARLIRTGGPATPAPTAAAPAREELLAEELEALEASGQQPGDGLPPELAAQAEARQSMSALAQPIVVRGSPHTVAHLSAEIARKLDAQHTRFQVELEPADMGRVDVRVEIGAGGVLNASLNFDSPHSAEAMRARSGELHAALEQAGFDLGGGLSFTAGGAGHGQTGEGERRARADAARDRGLPLAAEALPPIAVAAARPMGPGRLDIRI